MSECKNCGDETCGQNRAVLETWTLDRDCLARTAARARAAEAKLAESAAFEQLYYEQVELLKDARQWREDALLARRQATAMAEWRVATARDRDKLLAKGAAYKDVLRRFADLSVATVIRVDERDIKYILENIPLDYPCLAEED